MRIRNQQNPSASRQFERNLGRPLGGDGSATNTREASSPAAVSSPEGARPSEDSSIRGLGQAEPNLEPNRPTPQTAAAAREVSQAGVTLLQADVNRRLDLGIASGETLAQARPQTINGLSRQQAADFSLIPAERQADLENKAWNEYVVIYAHDDTFRDYEGGRGQYRDIPQLDFVDLRNILTDLKSRGDMTDIEKAFVWSEVVDMKGFGEEFEYTNDRINISNRGVQPQLIDSHPFRAWNTPSHTAVPFHDPVHGFGEFDGDYDGYAFDSMPQAIERIDAKEGGLLANPGDRNASIASTRAFHAWRDAPDGERFENFADTWIREIVEPEFQ